MRICWPRSSGWTGRHHRRIAGDSEIAEYVKIAARAHQSMIWSRVRQVNVLRSLLREYYPAALAAFGTDLASRDALAVLSVAPNPSWAGGCPKRVSKLCYGALAGNGTSPRPPPRSGPR